MQAEICFSKFFNHHSMSIYDFRQLSFIFEFYNHFYNQYFWLADHNDWSRWFAINSPHVYVVQLYSFIGGVAKK